MKARAPSSADREAQSSRFERWTQTNITGVSSSRLVPWWWLMSVAASIVVIAVGVGGTEVRDRRGTLVRRGGCSARALAVARVVRDHLEGLSVPEVESRPSGWSESHAPRRVVPDHPCLGRVDWFRRLCATSSVARVVIDRCKTSVRAAGPIWPAEARLAPSFSALRNRKPRAVQTDASEFCSDSTRHGGRCAKSRADHELERDPLLSLKPVRS